MSTANNVELLIITIILCILFAAVTGLILEVIVVVNKLRRVAKKAEAVVSNVESASEALKQMHKASKSRFPLVTFLSELFNSTKKE